MGTFVDETIHAGQTEAKGPGAGAYLTYDTAEREAVTAQVGLSYTSVANARLNRQQETEDGRLGFEEVRNRAHAQWEDYLGRIRVESASVADKTKSGTSFHRLACSMWPDWDVWIRRSHWAARSLTG